MTNNPFINGATIVNRSQLVLQGNRFSKYIGVMAV